MESLRTTSKDPRGGARNRGRIRDEEQAGLLTTALCVALVGAVIYFVVDMVLR